MIKVIKNFADFNESISKPAAAIYFHSEACGVCKVLLPQLEEMLNSNFPKLPLFVINANESMDLCGKLTVFTFPSLLIFFEGKESFRYARNINLAAMKGTINRPYSLLFD
ncbi:MAG TPA: thioredoxin family protein [Tenuifilaceae bacterium]|nr:thioredoxin family protein [Tenuifilaceae bacterium]